MGTNHILNLSPNYRKTLSKMLCGQVVGLCEKKENVVPSYMKGPEQINL